MNRRLLGPLSILLSALILLSTPARAGYDTAPYTIVEKDGDYELRDYPAMTVAQTGGPEKDDNGAFRRLFDYIQGGNAASQKIEMTTPVFMSGTSMSFVLPQAVGASAPTPASPNIKIVLLPAQRFAVYRYSGWRTEKNTSAALQHLQDWAKAKGLSPAAAPQFAYYNPPWTPGPWRRNEVLLTLGK